MNSEGEGVGGNSSLEIIPCVRKLPRRVSFQLDENGEVCVQILGEREDQDREEQLIIQNQKVRLTYSRGQIDPMRVMQVKDQMEKLTKRTKGEIREWPPNNQLTNLRNYNHLRSRSSRSKDDSNDDDDDADHNSDGDYYNNLFEDEIRRAGLVQYDGSFQPWFFGKITRRESESLLEKTESGTFLVRLSENTACCYSLSYRNSTSFRHFLIMMTMEPRAEYKLLGSYQSFGTLSSLVHHHGHSPITKSGNECLLVPCPKPLDFKVTF